MKSFSLGNRERASSIVLFYIFLVEMNESKTKLLHQRSTTTTAILNSTQITPDQATSTKITTTTTTPTTTKTTTEATTTTTATTRTTTTPTKLTIATQIAPNHSP